MSLVWGHSLHFAKFPNLRFSKQYSFNTFHQISPNLIQSIIIRGQCRFFCFCFCFFFFAICQKLKILWHFEFFLNIATYMGLEISKPYASYSFHSMSVKRIRTLATVVEYMLLLFLAISQVLKLLWHFEIIKAWFLEFVLGSFGALCKISWSIRFSKHYSFNSFHQISTKLDTKYHNQGLI